MSGGKPVFVSFMYSPRARMRWDSVHRVVSCLREENSFSRGSRAFARAGQVRMACSKECESISSQGQARSGFSSHQEGCVVR